MTRRFVHVTLLAAAAFAQQPADQMSELTLQFRHTESTRAHQEMATVIRSITEIRQAAIDNARRSFAVRGTPEQIGVAEWLFNELDRAPWAQKTTSREYKSKTPPEDIVRVFYLANTKDEQSLTEIAITVRSVTEIRRAFLYPNLHAVVMRGTVDQMAFAEWLFNELDQPAGARTAGVRNYAYAGDEGVSRIFYVSHVPDFFALQELSTVVRSTGEIRRSFVYRPQKAIVIRGTPGQIALAEWLVSELDRPAGEQRSAGQFRMQNSGDEATVKVLYGRDSSALPDFQEMARQLRTRTQIRRFFTYNPKRAMVVRGTDEQAASAQELHASSR